MLISPANWVSGQPVEMDQSFREDLHQPGYKPHNLPRSLADIPYGYSKAGTCLFLLLTAWANAKIVWTADNICRLGMGVEALPGDELSISGQNVRKKHLL